VLTGGIGATIDRTLLGETARTLEEELDRLATAKATDWTSMT
jgi:hypothetical protein